MLLENFVTMNFDRMGRRTFYKEEVNGVVTKHHRFVYDNYLCVQKVDALNNNSQINLFVWDPTEPVATRPLFTQRGTGYKFFYTCDGNKNVSEMVHFEQRTGIAAHSDYAPFGAVTRAISASAVTDNTFTTDNPFRFSSEYHDDTLGLVYYNYRHYNPIDGRWCGRDPLEEHIATNLYWMLHNNSINQTDYLGLSRVQSLFATNKYGAVYDVVISECQCVDGRYQWIRRSEEFVHEFTEVVTATFVWSPKDVLKNLSLGVIDEYLVSFVDDYIAGRVTDAVIDEVSKKYPSIGTMAKRGANVVEIVEHICKVKNIVEKMTSRPIGSFDALGNGDYYMISTSFKGQDSALKAVELNFDSIGTHVEPEPCTSTTLKKTHYSAKFKEYRVISYGEWTW